MASAPGFPEISELWLLPDCLEFELDSRIDLLDDERAGDDARMACRSLADRSRLHGLPLKMEETRACHGPAPHPTDSLFFSPELVRT
jgi:hypothetical protein